MNKTNSRRYFLNRLYFNAGRSINDDMIRYARHYINYKYLNVLASFILSNNYKNRYYINDCYSAFFDKLCIKISAEGCYGNVIVVLDPHFREKTICQMYFTENNLSLLNIDSVNSVCKSDNLYTHNGCNSSEKSRTIACEFLKKAYKYN